jgi:hypothetical protein
MADHTESQNIIIPNIHANGLLEITSQSKLIEDFQKRYEFINIGLI